MAVTQAIPITRHPFADGSYKQMLIDGKWVDAASGKRFETHNPATGELLATVAEGDAEDINRAVAAARRAFEGPWSKVRPFERQNLLLKLADLVEKNFDELSELDTLESEGVGCIAFSPLAQGLLTSRYLGGVPEGSRARLGGSFHEEMLNDENLAKVRALNDIAAARGQALAQMAIAWVLRDPRVTSAVVGASSVAQLDDTLGALENMAFSADELAQIDRYATESGVNLWAESGTA